MTVLGIIWKASQQAQSVKVNCGLTKHIYAPNSKFIRVNFAIFKLMRQAREGLLNVWKCFFSEVSPRIVFTCESSSLILLLGVWTKTEWPKNDSWTKTKIFWNNKIVFFQERLAQLQILLRSTFVYFPITLVSGFYLKKLYLAVNLSLRKIKFGFQSVSYKIPYIHCHYPFLTFKERLLDFQGKTKLVKIISISATLLSQSYELQCVTLQIMNNQMKFRHDGQIVAFK